MKITDFEAVIAAFHDARIQYRVAGGVAVNAHGYIRFTPNIDLALELRPEISVQQFGRWKSRTVTRRRQLTPRRSRIEISTSRQGRRRKRKC